MGCDVGGDLFLFQKVVRMSLLEHVDLGLSPASTFALHRGRARRGRRTWAESFVVGLFFFLGTTTGIAHLFLVCDLELSLGVKLRALEPLEAISYMKGQ